MSTARELAQNSVGTASPRGPGRPFAKGQSGNPAGRPKGILRAIREQTRDGDDLVAFVVRVEPLLSLALVQAVVADAERAGTS